MIWDSLLGEDRFAQGVTFYSDQFGYDPHSRIVLQVTVGFRVVTWAIVDTGAPWCIFDPDILADFDLDTIDERRLKIRGITYTGHLHRLPVTIDAESGVSLDVDATVFIPQLRPDDDWPHPNFLGLQGFLDRIRFAVDPAANNFYFGG